MSQGQTGNGTRQQVFIGPWQAVWLIVAILAAQDSTGVNRLLTQIAGRDLWLSILLAAPFALLGILGLISLARRFPGQDLLGILRRLLGPAGTALGLVYAALFCAGAALLAVEFTAMSHLVFVSTPAVVFLIFLVGSGIYAAVLGLEVTARVNTMLLLFVDIPLGVVLALLFIGQQRLANILPVMADGILPVLRGAQLVFGTWAQFVLLLMFLPATSRPEEVGRASLWALLLLALMALGHNLGPVLIFGDAVRRLTWPSFMQVRVIEVGRFIERLDVVGIWLWVHGFWVSITVYLYAMRQILEGLFGGRRRLWLTFPLGLAVMGLALAVPNQSVAMRVRWFLDGFAYPVLGFGVPLVLLGLAAVRGASPRPRPPASAERRKEPVERTRTRSPLV